MTDHKFRYAIYAAVSSDPQAREDKASLPDQVETARRAGKSQGGVETAGPYVLDGYSRTGYVNLSDALIDIPPLKEAINAAINDEYDVLLMDNVERMGDLAPMIATLFRKHRKQLHSARQSSRIYLPHEYDPASDESSNIMIHVEGIVQGYRQNKLRRGLVLGVRKRVEDGKYSINFPAGYIKRDKELVLDAPVADLLIRLKDLFLGGASLKQLATVANASQIPPPRGQQWERSSIANMLSNPFYAGKVFRDRWKMAKHYIKDGKKVNIMKRNPEATLYDGKHPPLWTQAEHRRILDEMEERYHQHPRRNPRNFSGLLRCSVCQKPLYFKNGKYRCYHHVRLPEAEADYLVMTAFAQALRDYSEEPKKEKRIEVDSIPAIERQIEKIHDRLERDIYTEEEAKRRIDAHRRRIEEIKNQQADQQDRAAFHERMEARRELLLPVVDDLPQVFRERDKRENNRFMREWVTAIDVTPDLEFDFHWR